MSRLQNASHQLTEQRPDDEGRLREAPNLQNVTRSRGRSPRPRRGVRMGDGGWGGLGLTGSTGVTGTRVSMTEESVRHPSSSFPRLPPPHAPGADNPLSPRPRLQLAGDGPGSTWPRQLHEPRSPLSPTKAKQERSTRS